MKVSELVKKLPDIFKALKAIHDLMEGHKFNTGALCVLVVLGLKQIGVGESEAQEIFSNCLVAFGSLLAVYGYIHKLIRAKAKPEPTEDHQ